MKLRWYQLTLGIALMALASVALWHTNSEAASPKTITTGAPMIGHMVYFTLKDSNTANRQKLVDACKKYLDKHEGTVYFSAGVLAEDFKREVNDREFDVALNLVFKDKAAHDKYAVHPRHIEFINECKDGWKKVRVFDSAIE